MATHGPQLRAIGRLLRRVGQSVDRVGLGFMGDAGFVEHLVPSTRVVPMKSGTFTYGLQNFVASSASVIGAVKFGEMSSLWYGATVRGDKGGVVIGRNTAILDNALVASTGSTPTVIGDDVIIQSGAIVRATSVGDGTMIGMGAVVLPGARIGHDCFIDAGAIVLAGTVVPPGTLWTGNPAKQLRTLAPEEMKYLRSMAVEYGNLSQRHWEQGEKTPAEVEEDAYWADYRAVKGMAPEDPTPAADPDVLKYYELTQPSSESGVFRTKEFNVAAELALREADEVAADAEENAVYARAARTRRIGSSLKSLSGVSVERTATREKLLFDLRTLDPEAAARVVDFCSRAATINANDAAGKAALVAEIAAVDPTDYYATDAERAAAATEIFDSLAAHGRAGVATGGAAASIGSGSSARAPASH